MSALRGARFEHVASPLDARRGPSFGAAWADIDADGSPELYLSCHYQRGKVWLLDRGDDGAWRDLAPSRFAAAAMIGDRHGGTFWDFDNDGDQDLSVPVGAAYGTGSEPNKFLVAERGRFVDRAVALGLAYPKARSRTTTMVDLDGDGLLDAACAVFARQDAPTTFFLQRLGSEPRFVNARDKLGGFEINCASVQLTHHSHHGLLLWMHGHPPQLLRVGDEPLVDMAKQVGLQGIGWLCDAAWADFDGDGALDLFLARSGNGSDLVQVAPDQVSALLHHKNAARGFELRAVDATLDLVLAGKVFDTGTAQPRQLLPQDVRIGAAGAAPAELTLRLDPGDAAQHGWPAAADPSMLRIGYLAEEKVWRVEADWPVRKQIEVALQTSTAVTDLRPLHFDLTDTAKRPQLFLQRDGRYERVGAGQCGLTAVMDSRAAVAADFDNDGDVDVYVVQRRPGSNPPNVYLENLGAARFKLHEGGAGAPGASSGRGDSAAVADFDGDGFLDLCVTGGEGEAPRCKEGVDSLYRGLPNGNHWLMCVLQGTRSNRDGIGAVVEVEAGGRCQVRLCDGGVHRFSQSDKTLHFGLGATKRVERITVRWPSGTTQVLGPCDANQVLRVLEPR